MFSHPPYHNMIVYSGKQWGQPHKDDLSRCYEEFIIKLNIVNIKIYNSFVKWWSSCNANRGYEGKWRYYSMIKDLDLAW